MSDIFFNQQNQKALKIQITLVFKLPVPKVFVFCFQANKLVETIQIGLSF